MSGSADGRPGGAAGRAQGSAAASADYSHRHHARPTPSEFLAAHLGDSHPLFSEETPLSQVKASAYQVDSRTTSALMRSVWTSLLHSLPSPANLLSVRTAQHAQLPTIDAALDFLEKHDWKLAEAQKAAAKLAEQATDKGKGKAGAAPGAGSGTEAHGRDGKRVQLGPEYGADRRGMPCGHIFKKGEAIYRCRDCAHDDTCVQCAPCFNASNHEGHDIVFSVSSDSGGCCDCGDEEAWKQPLGCTYHEVPRLTLAQESGPSSSGTAAAPPREEGMELDDEGANGSSASSISGKGKERATDVGMSHTSSTATSSSRGQTAEMADLLRTIPETIREALEAHIGSILDYVLDTLEHAPESATIPKTASAISQIKSASTLMPDHRRRQSTATGSASGSSDATTGRNSMDSETDFFDQGDSTSHMPGSWGSPPSSRRRGDDNGDASDERSSSSALDFMLEDPYAFGGDFEGTEVQTPRPGGPRRGTIVGRRQSGAGVKRKSDEERDERENDRYYTLLLWNDEKHDFTQVIDIVMDVTGRSMLAAKFVAERVDKHGREIIEVHRDVTRLLLWGLKLNSIDLAVSIRPSYDVFAEEIAGLLVKHLLDLASSVLYVPPVGGVAEDNEEDALRTHPFDKLVPSAAQMRAIVTNALLEPWDHTKPIYAESMSAAFFSGSDLRRLDGLLLLESKLWKELRGNVKETFMACIGVKETRKEIALRFAHMYSKVIETFILRDREPEHSICFMTVQLFSVPSIASSLVAEVGFLETLLLILQAIFTSTSGTDPLTLPPLPPVKGQANPASPLFKQQRCYHIFYDVRYLLGADGVQRQLVEKHSHLNYFLDFLSLFNAVNPDKRAVDQHVEYESEVWIPVFHVSSHLGRAAKLFGEAFAKATPVQLATALGLTARRILLNCLTLHQNDPDVHAPIVFKNAIFGGRVFQTIQFDVARQAVSFHHPMHWLFAEMLKHTQVLSGANITAMGKSGLAELLQTDVDENGVLVLLEFPLRVTVKLAQVRSGMWVRNGYALRSQAHHYRENPMRDIMYDQDLFLLQCGFTLASPERWLVTMIERFGLTKFFEYGTLGGEHTELMADEFVLILIHLLTEVAIIGGWSMEKQIRREIVHFLALGSGTYSEITKHVSERYTDHHAFERVLGQVSSFRAPDGITDLGIFELRDDAYDEVRPYFMHYTRNQREKAEEVLIERHKKRGGKEEAATYWAASRPDLDNTGPYPTDRMHAVLLTNAFVEILYTTLLNCQKGEAEQIPESLLESTLHLVSVGLSIKEAEFAKKMLHVSLPSREIANSSLFAVLCKIESDDRLKSVKSKVSWLLERASKLVQNANVPDDLVRLNAIFQELGKAPMASEEQSSDKARLEAKRAAAKARQAAIMQKFSAQQKDLLKSFGEDGDDDEELDDSMEHSTEEENVRARFGACILCQDGLDPSKPFGMLAHVQPSRVMRTMPCGDADAIAQAVSTPLTLDRGAGNSGGRQRGVHASSSAEEAGRPAGAFPPAFNKPGLHTTTCGHMMHAACFWEYCRTVEQRHALQIAREHPEDLSRCEFVCPLCKALGNVILPLRESHRCESLYGASKTPLDTTALPDWIRRINIDILKWSTAKSPMCQEPEVGTGTFLTWYAEDAFSTLHMSERDAGDLDVDTFHMFDRVLTVLRLISSELKPLRVKMQQRTILSLPSRKLYIPQDVIAHTLSMIEISQRGQAPPSGNAADVTGGVSESMLNLVASLLHCLRISAMVQYGGGATDGGTKAAELIRQGLLKRLLPHWAGDEAVRSPLLLRDPLGILVEAAVVAPEALDQVTTLMYYVTLVQLVFGLAQPSMWPQGPGSAAGSRAAFASSSSIGDQLDLDIATARQVFPDVRWTTANIVGLVGYARGNITLGVDHLDDDILAKLLCSHSLPFLRRAALLRSTVHGPLPQATSQDAKAPEYLRLMDQLKIPLPSVALPARAEKQTHLASLIEGWIKHAYAPLASLFRPLPIHYSTANAMGGFNAQPLQNAPPHPTLLLEHPHIYELVDLPHDLATLLQETQQRVCQRCKEVPADPALCLLCGEIVCYQSFCCQSEDGKRGECNRHMDDCGGAIGIYFKVKTNVILLLFEQTGTFLFSPYLDSHGEVDIGLRKGRPQKLHRQRYDELRKQWLQHGVSNLVARKIEASMDNGGWGTM